MPLRGDWGAKHQQEGRAPPPRVPLVNSRSVGPRPSRVLRSSRGRFPDRKPNVWSRRSPGSPALKFPGKPNGAAPPPRARRISFGQAGSAPGPGRHTHFSPSGPVSPLQGKLRAGLVT
ncbi:hypothetical protein NDU88_004343 [Pleurodeles waltl]|uniref:Uncharacterized protein n=1 Tax=Pleurodeles waltl TaxID=8319 RepID=A0AAV7UIU7_PLEWA|nr:hypothetical protein NDU88_004343 [Pleurodeles waltl]